MRAFLAIPLPDHVVDALALVQQALTMGRVVPRQNLHMTLAFLDDQTETTLETLHDRLGCIALAPFEVRFQGIGTLGGKAPRIACALIENTAPLRELHKKIRGAARASDINLPRERFRPHVTLARFRKDMGHDQTLKLSDVLAGQGGSTLPPFRATEFSLVQSRLFPEGARYDTLATYPLYPPNT